jgi:ribosomal protein S6E (S10)
MGFWHSQGRRRTVRQQILVSALRDGFKKHDGFKKKENSRGVS